MIVVLDLIGHGQIGGIEDPRLAAEELEQARGLFNHEPRIGAFAHGAIEQQDARRRIEFVQTQRRTTMSIFRLERRKMVGIGKRPQPGQTRVVHARTSAGTLPGNQRSPNQKATFTSRISTGTSTSGPRSEEHTSELQSLMRISYAVFCLKKKKRQSTD